MSRRLPLNPWLLAPLAVALAAAATWRQRARVPSRDDWRAAVAYVRAHRAAGDGVAWTPYWAGEGRLLFHDLSGVFHLLDVEHADLARYDRVWLMGAFGYGAEDLPEGHTVRERQAFGPLTLELVEVGGPRVVGDLYAELESAHVYRVGRGGRRQDCDFWDGRGWQCDLRLTPDATRRCLGEPLARRQSRMRRRGAFCPPNDCSAATCGLNPWLNVSRDVRKIGGGPRRCVWFHPIRAATLTLEWPGAPAGDELVIDYGFTDRVISDHDAPGTHVGPAKLRVLRGDVTVLETPVTPEWGWRRVRAPLSGPAAPLKIEITTPSQRDAHFCFDPTIRAGRASRASRRSAP